jgi:uncharacterized damage-inducible protein DinB
MGRAGLDVMLAALEAAYRGDRFHSLLGNLGDVTDEEWATRPAEYSSEVFGTQPELSIADLVRHVGGAKLMWGNHAFGDRSLTWAESGPPSEERGAVMGWLEEAHAGFVAGVEVLGDDAELVAERMAHWGRPLPTQAIISLVINHDLYHSGEINRQRGLIRGASGWARPE